MKSHFRRNHENHRSFLLPWEKALPVYKREPEKSQIKAVNVLSQSAPKQEQKISDLNTEWFLERVKADDFECFDSRERLNLAALWFREFRFEKESMNQISSIMQELLLKSAPVALIRGCARALLDEVEHQRLSVSLVRALGSADISFREASNPHDSLLTADELVEGASKAEYRGAEGSPNFSQSKEDFLELAWRTLQQGVLVQELSARFSIHLSRDKTYSIVVAELLKKSIDEHRHSDLYWDIFAWALKKLGREHVDRLWTMWTNLPKAKFEDALLGDGKCRDFYREVKTDISERLKSFFEQEWGLVLGENNQIEKALPLSRPAS